MLATVAAAAAAKKGCFEETSDSYYSGPQRTAGEIDLQAYWTEH